MSESTVTPTTHTSTKALYWAVVISFAVLGFLIYGHAMQYAFVRWDDGLLIFENPYIRGMSLENLKWIFTHFDPELYIPLTFLSYQLDYTIGGTNPAIYHFTNLVLHISNALLVSFSVKLLSKKQWMGMLCGLLFLVHPLHTEAAIWASARKDLLSTFFLLASFSAYLVSDNRGSPKLYWMSVVLYVCGLLSKVTIIGFPVLLLLYHWKNKDRTWKPVLPFFLLSIVLGIVAILGKTDVLGRSVLSETVLMAFKSSWFYLTTLVAPVHLSVLYPYTGDISIANPDFFVPLLLVTLLIGLALWSTRFTRNILFGLGFFFILTAPTFFNFAKGDLDIYFASDRYAYAGSIGIFYLFAIGIQWLEKRYSRVSPMHIAGGALVIICTFAVMAFMQSRVWANTETLFGNVLEHYPNSYVAHNNLANAKLTHGDIDAALSGYRSALALKEHPRTYTNLGSALRQKQQAEESIQSYKSALSMNPHWYQAHMGLGIVYASQGDAVAAEEEYKQALSIQPEHVTSMINLASLYVQQGRNEEAIELLETATELNPFYPQAFFNLGVAYRNMNKPRQARDAYEKARDLEPSFVAARINLGILYAERKDIEEAKAEFEAVLQYDPGNQRAQAALEQLR